MDKYSGIIGWTISSLMIAAIIYSIAKELFIKWKIKQDPVQAYARITHYYPKTPSNSGKTDIVTTYTFCVNNIHFTKKNETITINSIDLDKYHIGKEIPVIYNRADPKFNAVDRYHKKESD